MKIITDHNYRDQNYCDVTSPYMFVKIFHLTKLTRLVTIGDIWTQQRQSVSPCKLSEQNFENFTIRGRFSDKTQKLLTKCSGHATSGRHNSAMIADRRKFISKWSIYRMSSFHFYR